jgi:putative polyketide hydroxylase
MTHAWVDGSARRVSTLDLLGPGLTLFTGPAGAAAPHAAAAGPAPVTERRLDELSARALGIRSGGSLVVRPDGAPLDRAPGEGLGSPPWPTTSRSATARTR